MIIYEDLTQKSSIHQETFWGPVIINKKNVSEIIQNTKRKLEEMKKLKPRGERRSIIVFDQQ